MYTVRGRKTIVILFGRFEVHNRLFSALQILYSRKWPQRRHISAKGYGCVLLLLIISLLLFIKIHQAIPGKMI